MSAELIPLLARAIYYARSKDIHTRRVYPLTPEEHHEDHFSGATIISLYEARAERMLNQYPEKVETTFQLAFALLCEREEEREKATRATHSAMIRHA